MTTDEFSKVKKGDIVVFLGSARLPNHAGASAEVVVKNEQHVILSFEDGSRVFATKDQIEEE